MKLIRNLFIGAALVFSTALTSHAIDRVYSVPVQLNAAGATETVVTVSTGGTGQSTIVLAANANRLDFDIELTSCAVTTSKVFYAYDSGGFTIGAPSAIAANWVNFSSTDPTQRRFLKPDWIMPVGAINAITDGAASSCFLIVREWVSTSPLFQ